MESTGRIYRKKIEKILNKKIDAIKNAYELLFVKKIPRNDVVDAFDNEKLWKKTHNLPFGNKNSSKNKL